MLPIGKHMKSAKVALAVRCLQDRPQIVEILSDEQEIEILEASFKEGLKIESLEKIYEYRRRLNEQEEQFGNYVEDLLAHPFIRKEIRDHGLQWLKSKMRIEQYEKTEKEAAQVIADFAMKVFASNPSKTDFMIAGPKSQVRVLVFVLPETKAPSGKRVA
jgi:hypothetical protein